MHCTLKFEIAEETDLKRSLKNEYEKEIPDAIHNIDE